ncbi:PTS system fructose-specific IIA component [Allostreptomyces psammosilenae]|uniref:PTS system fructose-specific IIA component n=1 Tax=Allostreptomyces psammosilenae TaxID=1892865 RepID=A0A853A586_9ACTN|nr:PTS system fructose-specific IIA component [Allostreptomyces psammosilenae]
MADLITTDLVDLSLEAADRHEAARVLATRLAAAGRVTDLEGFLADVRARETQMATGIEGGIGIPHARSAHVTEPTLAFGRAVTGVDFEAEDGPADLIFLIAAPAEGDSEHISILAALARRLIHASFKDALRSAAAPQDVVDLINKEVLGR